ncbi:3-methyl-2-oxobutanoate hydroxymethyltransferase [Candidatus Acetothermia bacterium]|nr:3-methyl-2-oxobutanoate hydroxymethyltransferase [Candidatus Acetothermia bacterium]MCI2427180.1 3-methyl-2-oxobutanoate hydroxymethyltransferase [Candidatus Acetothermia bacterium]MCI2428060.1 3-methyl-2-oxobutanoate hydroxymethyltransferase [Candidatus Acetothermia bacterium]
MRITINTIKRMCMEGEKIVMLTAYDYLTALLVDNAGVPMILVGDSLAMMVLGYETTLPVTLDEMVHHTRAVVRGTARALIVSDMPFMTYHINIATALENAARFIQHGGAQAVKLEGGITTAKTIKRIVDCGIPVMGHIGLTPQSVHQLGGFKVQGKTTHSARQVLNDAMAVEEAGAFAIVLECIPSPLAQLISERLSIPTIGIGAGPHCDGQVQVLSDILGLSPGSVPRHAKRYTDLAQEITTAVTAYINDVKGGTFPDADHSTMIDQSLLAEL